MRRAALLLLLLFCLFPVPGEAARRFPPPDFESGYTQPPLTFQEPRSGLFVYLDAAVLIGALLLAAWLLHRRRSRTGLFVLGIFALGYFGFYKEGCVCPIGAIQNVSLAAVDRAFPISIPVVLIFFAPLLIALFYGRVFCGAVCPLGAIQDLFIWRPVAVNRSLERALGLVRFLYLGLAVYFALAWQRFIICEYDPFVGLFRFSGPLWKILMGATFLLVGLVLARPYCRYLCPYGAILSLFSRWSGREVRIAPDECTNCTLCHSVCPFEAIHPPEEPARDAPVLRGRLLLVVLLLVTLPALGGYFALSRSLPGAFLGLWFGLVLGLSTVSLLVRARRRTYQADPAECLSCGRCYEWCPYERERWEEEPGHAS